MEATSSEVQAIMGGNDDVNMAEEKPEQTSRLLSNFRGAVHECINKCLKTDMKIIAKCYPSVWKKNKDILEALVQQVSEQARGKLKDELETAIQNEDLPNLLNVMEGLLEASKKAESDKTAWRPTGNPEADSRAYFMALKKRKLQELEAELQKSQTEERKLHEVVLSKREKLSETESQIKSFCEATTVNESMTKFKVQNDDFMTMFEMTKDSSTESD
eukprot:Seg2162.4 transcript_id=Seg2162.4/GoldUCD/mRNA.D3Y31 product="Polyamine-modulated factor 1" protein_id=Seg2162.4/GoldUCD/D3Y31